MRKQLITLTALTLGLSTVAANTQLSDIRSHAANVQRQSESMSQLLKAKSPDVSQLREKLDLASADIAKLKTLVAELEGSSTVAQSRDWQLLKERVQLLDIFHNAKREMVTTDQVAKKRSILRAHADGIAKRAAMLQVTVDRLAKP